jgi:ABC-type transporter Mla subunit MlaD
MADRLQVDLDGLAAFAADLAGLRARLTAMADVEAGAEVGSPRLAAELDDFTSHWRDGRSRIDGHLERLGALAALAAETLRETDGRLASGVGRGR